MLQPCQGPNFCSSAWNHFERDWPSREFLLLGKKHTTEGPTAEFPDQLKACERLTHLGNQSIECLRGRSSNDLLRWIG